MREFLSGDSGRRKENDLGKESDRRKEFDALVAYLRQPGFEDRVLWEQQQLQKLASIPLVGKAMFRLARWAVKRWTGDLGLQ